ncbi:unnamed protein product [Ilex paraguariensis]|uniref:Uncharacterized protein n=1 Tax=Ilex paraguariensis TaxID=185542 RepID=A0ABC8T748_9AQUA
MGYSDPDKLIENERANKDFGKNHKVAIDDFDVSLPCERFPCITLGHAPVVELYDEMTCSSGNSGLLAAQTCKRFFPSPITSMWDPDCLTQAWPSLYPKLPDVDSSQREENFATSMFTQSQTMKKQVEQDLQTTMDEPSSRSGLGTQQSAVSVELILDKSISSIPGLSKRQCRQLESCGFHTLRRLLHHFPRTYADLQNAQVGIEDGQYLIFVGKILSSRGIKASYSFSFLEVVVGCEVVDIESTSGHMVDEIDSGSKRMIYLHLKKFFRGTRFTFQPFLRSLQEKYKEGDIVCVSGKVSSRISLL